MANNQAKQDRYRKRVEDVLMKRIVAAMRSPERLAYESQIAENEFRYEAKRSIGGWKQTGDMTGKVKKTEPWKGCSDKGYPASKILKKQLLPVLMDAHLGGKPITDSSRITDDGEKKAGEVDDFLNYDLMERAKLYPKRKMVIDAALIQAEGIEKVVLEPQERLIKQNRLVLRHGKELLMGDKEPIEVVDREKLVESLQRTLIGEAPRARVMRTALAQGMTNEDALKMAGFEVNQEKGWVKVAPLIKGEQGFPVPDVDNMVKYEVVEEEITTTITYRQGVECKHIATKDFLFPPDSITNDISEMEWCGHRYPGELSWLHEMKGDDPEDFYPDVVEEIIKLYLTNTNETEGTDYSKLTQKPEIYEIYARFALEVEDEEDEDYLKEEEIICRYWTGLGSNDEQTAQSGKLLNWISNPNSRFECKHIRPLFLYQPWPKRNQVHGDSLPELVAPIRDNIDFKQNQRNDRMSLSNHPPMIYDKDTFAKIGPVKLYPGASWLVNSMNNQPRTLDLFKNNEEINLIDERADIQLIALLIGATEAYSGMSPSTESKTLGEYKDLMGKTSLMLQDAIRSINATADEEYEYIMNLYRFADVPLSDKFPTTDGKTMAMRDIFEDKNIVIRTRGFKSMQAEQSELKGIMELIKMMMDTQSPELKVPRYRAALFAEIQDLLNLESIKSPTEEEIAQAIKSLSKQAAMEEIQKPLQGAVNSITNKGQKKFIEQTFLKAGMGDLFGIKDQQA